MMRLACAALASRIANAIVLTRHHEGRDLSQGFITADWVADLEEIDTVLSECVKSLEERWEEKGKAAEGRAEGLYTDGLDTLGQINRRHRCSAPAMSQILEMETLRASPIETSLRNAGSEAGSPVSR